MKPTRPNENPWRAFAFVSIIGADLVVCMVGGYWIGQQISNISGGNKAWIAVGMVTGFFVGVASVILIIRKFMEGPNG